MKDWMKVMLANLVAGALLLWWWQRRAGGAQAATGDQSSASPSGAAGTDYSIAVSPAGGGAPDYSALAAAISALAAGVALPNILTVQKTISTGTTELVAAESGKRVCVLAYSVSATGAATVLFRTAGTSIWRVDLDAPAGKSGANLATAWPGYLFAGAGSQNLEANTTAAAEAAVTYWMEAA